MGKPALTEGSEKRYKEKLQRQIYERDLKEAIERYAIEKPRQWFDDDALLRAYLKGKYGL